MAAKAAVSVTGEVREGRNLGLDVLRVAATVSVLLSHFGVFAAVHWKMPHADLMFIAGPFGLAAFFVLSGFLIGNILLRVVEQGVDFRGWRNFTLRRLLRVLPTYVLWVLVLASLDPPGGLHFGVLAHYLTLTQNFAWPMPADGWFGVSWSLTVEVWFYLMFGALSLAAARFAGLRGLVVVLALFLVLPPAIRLGLPTALPWDAWIRKIALLRVDAIATGVALALVMRHSSWVVRHRRLMAVLGALLLLATLAAWVLIVEGFELHDRLARALVFNSLQLGVALLVPQLLQMRSNSLRACSTWAWFSDATYAIYLVHLNMLLWALVLVAHGMLSFGAGLVLALAMTMLWAAFSLHVIERPIRRFRLRLRTVAADPSSVTC